MLFLRASNCACKSVWAVERSSKLFCLACTAFISILIMSCALVLSFSKASMLSLAVFNSCFWVTCSFLRLSCSACRVVSSASALSHAAQVSLISCFCTVMISSFSLICYLSFWMIDLPRALKLFEFVEFFWKFDVVLLQVLILTEIYCCIIDGNISFCSECGDLFLQVLF